MRRIVAGLDGGGTKTIAVLGDANAHVVGSGIGGPCNVAAMSVEDAVDSAMQSILRACDDAGGIDLTEIACVCACVAGFSAVPKRLAFAAALQRHFPLARVVVEPDYAAAFTGSTGGHPGIVVIAGTGSVAYAEDGSGKTARAGAYGYLIEDAGSGYGVGREAIAAVLKAADGSGPATSLTERLLDSVGASNSWDLVSEVYGGRLDRVAIASLAALVSGEAQAGDEVAAKILHRAGGALAILAEAVSRKLFTVEPFVVSCIGSLWQSGPSLSDVFGRSVSRFAPAARIVPPVLPPEQGALLRALRAGDTHK